MPVAKSLSGGYVPVGALLMSDAVYDAVFDSLEHAFSARLDLRAERLRDGRGAGDAARARRPRPRRRLRPAGRAAARATRPLVERYEVVKDVRGLGLMWAIEFGEPDKGRTTWRMLEKMQPGIFAQLVVVPLFTDHRILSQVAGHRVNIVKGLPPLVDHRGRRRLVRERARQVVGEAQKMGRSMTSFALRAARAGRARKPAAARA